MRVPPAAAAIPGVIPGYKSQSSLGKCTECPQQSVGVFLAAFLAVLILAAALLVGGCSALVRFRVLVSSGGVSPRRPLLCVVTARVQRLMNKPVLD